MKDITFTLQYTPQPTTTSIVIGSQLLPKIDSTPYVVLCDDKVNHPILEKAAFVLSLPGGEGLKTRKMKEWIEDELLKANLQSDMQLIAMGGGTLCDLAGFIASTFCRGIPYTIFPTTLLAMCDAAIGGKNGVNVIQSKNFIGTIYQPQTVYIDVNFLKTLPQIELQNGLVEIVKHSLLEGVSLDLEPFLRREAQPLIDVISKSVEYKKKIVEFSCHTPQARDLLNFGHTIGHAIEALEGYGNISHGQAVAIGMMAESKLTRFPEEKIQAIHQQILSIGLPLALSRRYSIEEWQAALAFDKKTKGKEGKKRPRFVLLDEVVDGAFACHEVNEDILNEVLEWVNREYSPLSSKL
ncbi:MAG: aroB [Chlamydiia bacterium]|nr:aroB [Chlamydiia bacterium]